MSSSFLEYWEQVKFRLESEFRQWVPELFRDLPQSQVDAILRSLKAGKRIRGCLVCLVCEALDGDIDAAVSKAVGIECIQAASLIHDDYVDGDKIRRNRPAEWTLQGSRQAVLLGDVIFASVIGKMVEEGIEEGSLISKAIAAMAMGAYQEHLDRLKFERLAREGNYRPETYERVIHLKTGVLFAAAAQLGAIAAKASAPERRRAFNFGARLGEAYQIADDLVEVLKLEHLPRRERVEDQVAKLYFVRAEPHRPALQKDPANPIEIQDDKSEVPIDGGEEWLGLEIKIWYEK